MHQLGHRLTVLCRKAIDQVLGQCMKEALAARGLAFPRTSILLNV